jgi:UDP-glucose 4-epimerase
MRRALGNTKVKFYIGDVRHYDSLVPAMKGVDLVFHAAASKQAPSCEFFPYEAVHVTVCRLASHLRACVEHWPVRRV